MRLSTSIKWFFVVFFIIAGIYIVSNYGDKLGLSELRQTIESFGIWAPLVFIGIYITATVFFLPGAILTMAGGLLFGPILGTVYNLCGAVIGSTLAFLVARYIASDWVADKTGGKLKQIIQGVEQEGWKFVALLRLVPLIPFNLLNYALGLTKINILAYIIASAIFMAPGTFVYTYVGSLGEAVIRGDGGEIAFKILIAIGLFAILAAIPYIIKKVRNKNNGDPGP